MIRVSHLREFTRPDRVEHELVAWGVDATPRALAPRWWDPDDSCARCSRNGGMVADLDALLADGDHVFYWVRPGIIFQGIGVFAKVAFILNTIELVALSYLVQRLLLPKAKPGFPDDSKGSLAFDRQENNRSEGAPIPVIYGRHRVVPPIINQFVRSSFDANGEAQSELFVLLLLGEGPVNKIGDKTADGGPFFPAQGTFQTLQIENQPAENLDDVEVHVRMGNLEQASIPGFSEPVLQQLVGLGMHAHATLAKVTSVSATPIDTGSTANTIAVDSAGGPTPATNATITKWNDVGGAKVAYTMGSAADEATIVLRFPSGLGDYSGTAPTTNDFLFQVRYRAVDSGGAPFGDYIVHPARIVTMRRQGEAFSNYLVTFYDPNAAYTGFIKGFFLRTKATGATPTTTNPGVTHRVNSTIFPTPPNTQGFSFACWIRARVVSGTATTAKRIFQWSDTASPTTLTKGFMLSIGKNTGSNASITFVFGTGASRVTITSGPSTDYYKLINDTAAWHHLVVTYKPNAVNSSTRIRIYLDGVNRSGDVLSGSKATWADTATTDIRMWGEQASAAFGYDAHFDESTFWSKELTPFEVSQLFGGGAPPPTDALASGLIIGARYDDQIGTSPNLYTSAFGPAVNTALTPPGWKLGSGADAATDPQVSNQPTSAVGIVTTLEGGVGTKKADRYLIEILRLNVEDVVSLTGKVGQLDACDWDSVQLRTLQTFEYPGMALLAVRVRATDQVEGGAPLFSVIVEGRLVPKWDGISATSPNTPVTYSRNPAWVAADMLTNPDFGLGALYRIQDLDLPALLAFAGFCDQYVYDNSQRQAVVEARQLDATESPASVNQDCVRFRLNALPANFPPLSTVDVSNVVTNPTEKRLTFKLSTPVPAQPAWVDTEVAAGAQQILLVSYDATLDDFYIYAKSSVAVAPAQPAYTPTSGVEAEVHDVRHRYDATHERADVSAWDAVIATLQTARAAPVRVGRRISVFVDTTANPVALVTMGNVIEGSWRQDFEDVAERANAESAEFFDEDLNYERTSASDEHPELNDPAKQSSFVWRRTRVEGVTRRGQVKRGLRRDLNAFFLLRRIQEFELGIDALPMQPGDVFGISHDVPGYGLASGRVYADSADGTTVKLDRQVVLAAATTYQVQVEHAASGVRETKTISTAAGTYPAGTALSVSSAFSFTPAADDKYAIGPQASGETKLYRLIETNLDPRTLRTKCRAIEYNAAVYSDDFGTLPAISASTIPVPGPVLIPPGAENLTAGEETNRWHDGTVRITAYVNWDYDESYSHSIGGSHVFVSDGSAAADGRDPFAGAEQVATLDRHARSVRIENYTFEPNRTYYIWVQPFTQGGTVGHRRKASRVEFKPSGLGPAPAPPTNLRAYVSGERAAYEWDDAGELDSGATVEARRGGWIMGIRVFEMPAQARGTPPIPDWLDAPANELGVSTPDLVVRTKLRTGQYGPALVAAPALAVRNHYGAALSGSEEDTDWI